MNKNEIEQARIKMGEYACRMTDDEIEVLLSQIKKMVTLAVELVEREME